MRSVLRHSSCLKRDTEVNTCYLARAFVTAASVLLPIAGHGDTGTRGPANAWVLDVRASLMPEVAKSAR
jgi:hypothetical protein